MSTLIEQLREKRSALIDSIESTVTSAVEQERDLSEAEDSNVTALRSEVDKLDARIDQLVDIAVRRAADAELSAKVTTETKTVKVTEPELYRENGEHEFVRDVLSASQGNTDAMTRLYAHNEAHRAGTTGDLGGFIVPSYVTNLFADRKVEGRPFADIVTNVPLSSASVTVPRQKANAAVAAQDGENTAGGNSDFETEPLTINARTILGHADTSVQSIDFGTLTPQLIINDLLKSYNVELDRQTIKGSNLNGEMKGLVNSTVNDVSGASVADAQDLWETVGAAKVAVRKAMNAAATHLVVTPDLWGWIESQTDSDGRPIFGFGFSAPTNVQGQGLTYHGLRVVQDSNLPYVASTSQTAAVVKADELILWEQGPRTMRVDQPGAHTGTVRFVISGYAAFTAERYAGATCLIENLPDLALIGS